MTANPLSRALHLLMAFTLVLSQLLLLAPSTAFGAPVVMVNSTGDGVDTNPGDLVCSTGGTNSEGAVECTLRAAIQEANASGPVDEILFSIPATDPGHSGGTFLIRPGTGLPYLSQRVVVDGTSQPGYSAWPVVIVDGSVAASNADGPDGLLIDGNQVTVRGLVVRNWRDDGIEIHANRATIVGNYIHHNDDGVLIENGSRNVIGDDNVISGNRKHGVSIDRGSDNEVRGNYIGLASDGSSAMPNAGNGVEIWGGTIRATVGPGNVISGNDGVGINVTGTSGRTDIFDNLIGLSADGTAGVGNASHGIEISATGAATYVGTGNVVSGNGGYGIVSASSSGRVVVSSNRVGTDVSGSAGLANASAGVRIASTNADVIDNQISGNDGSGLEILGAGAVVNTNLIGTDSSGTAAIGNGGNGISIAPGAATGDIGGTIVSLGNVVAFNGGAGIGVAAATDTRVSITSNTIFANGGPGIDLPKVVGSIDPNDPNDTDTGANDLLNYPVITSAEETAGDVYVDFDLDVPNGWYRIEFYVGDGRTLASSTMVQHTNLIESFSHVFAGADGEELIATATRCNDETCTNARFTSEFSSPHTITIGNHEPVIGPVTPQTVDEEETLVYMVPASDLDPDTLTFSMTGSEVGAVIDPNTGIFTWTPTETQGPNTYTFDITVNDHGSPVELTDTATLTVTVNEVNRPPVLANPGNKTIAEGSTLTFTATATDPDIPDNTLTYTLDGAPTGAVIDPDTGVFTWTPTETQGPNTYTLDVTVSDNATPTLTHTRTITITVNEVNEAPTVTNPGDQSNAEGDTIDLPITATDPDWPANTLTYTATGLPPGLAINPTTGQITGQIQYHAAENTPYTTTITVTDNGTPNRSHTTTITWDTANTNRPPILNNPGNKTTNEQTTLTFTATATDPDTGTILTYHLNGAPTGAVIDPNTGIFTWTPTETQGPNTYTFDITVNDNDVDNLSHTRTVTITVAEVNTPPVAADDAGVTNEDNPVTVTVLANDSDVDRPANRLGVSSVQRPAAGQAIITRSGKITYIPPANYHGTVVFDYTVSDGTATDTASVSIVVNSINDAPVAGNDEYRLTRYRPTQLHVLDNDADADGDPLGISLVTYPETGLARIEGDYVVYEPVNGWTGSVNFSYRVRDRHGASSTASVKILVGDEVLVGARNLATNLGVDIVSFEPPTPNFDAATLSLINLDGITLLADSFFQTVEALRIPLGFLGVTVVMVVGLGTTAKVPALVFGTRRRHWAVVRLGRQQRLPAYSEPGGRKVVYNYDPTAAGIVSLGRPVTVGNTEWLPVDTPNGRAWIYRKYLTEQLDLEAFLDDTRPTRLVHELAARLRSGRSVDSLISSEGLMIALTGSPSRIASDQVTALMGDRRLRHLPGTDGSLNTPEEFAVAVAEPFLEAYDATPDVSPDVAHSRSALIPTECWNFPYLAIGTGTGVQPWLVFFEYRNGKAFIAGLGIDE